jgi:hypothetical protein
MHWKKQESYVILVRNCNKHKEKLTNYENRGKILFKIRPIRAYGGGGRSGRGGGSITGT